MKNKLWLFLSLALTGIGAYLLSIDSISVKIFGVILTISGGFLTYKVSNKNAANDKNQIIEKIDQFKGEGSFEGWMKRIVVNESLTYLRRNKNMYLKMDIEAADREPDFEKLESHLQAEDLMKLIEALPSGYRIVFNLYAIDGYSHKEIGEQLGISENTSKSQLSRARVALQKSLLETEKNLIHKTI